MVDGVVKGEFLCAIFFVLEELVDAIGLTGNGVHDNAKRSRKHTVAAVLDVCVGQMFGSQVRPYNPSRLVPRDGRVRDCKDCHPLGGPSWLGLVAISS